MPLFKKFLFFLGCLFLLTIGLAVIPALTLAGPPAPTGATTDLEAFWQEMYGSQITADYIDEFIATLKREQLAKAEPDECYQGNPDGPPCSSGQPKVNQAYVWGLAKAGDTLWFGTAPNVHCLVMGGLMEATAGTPPPLETNSWVCEYGAATYPTPLSDPLPESISDWRPPKIYTYNLTDKTLTDMLVGYDPWLTRTLGIRSAGALDDLVILGGPDLEAGINLFAFNTKTGAHISSTNLPQYDNIRKWRVVQGVLYTAVGNSGFDGKVLRWTGSITAPFQFEEVGNLNGAGAELVEHDGRLFVTTWPDLGQPGDVAELVMSPSLPAGGLTTAHAGSWETVWQATDYDPDPVTAKTYGGGALASFDGYLYWGTMHVPLLSSLYHQAVFEQQLDQLGATDRLGYPDPYEHPEEVPNIFLGPYRAISLFRGSDFNTDPPKLELLYGAEELPQPAISHTVTISGTETFTDTAVVWEMQPTLMGPPQMGQAGFGNFFNNYTWTMAVYQNQLYVGTMDWAYLAEDVIQTFQEALVGENVVAINLPPRMGTGADLWRFPSAKEKAAPESIEGVGNYTNYGIRTMVVDDALYLGTANPMNLLTDPTDDVPEGGWELIQLRGNRLVYLPSVLKQ